MWEKAIWSDETKLNLLAYMQNVAASCCGDVFQGCREREAGHLMGRLVALNIGQRFQASSSVVIQSVDKACSADCLF